MILEDVQRSKNLIQKKIRAYRDELRYNKTDDEFVKSRRDKIHKLKIIAQELGVLIRQLKDEKVNP
jgi:hypothetical protein